MSQTNQSHKCGCEDEYPLEGEFNLTAMTKRMKHHRMWNYIFIAVFLSYAIMHYFLIEDICQALTLNRGD